MPRHLIGLALIALTACNSTGSPKLEGLQAALDAEYVKDKLVAEDVAKYRQLYAQLKSDDARFAAWSGLSSEALEKQLRAQPGGGVQVVRQDNLLGVSGRGDRAQILEALKNIAKLAPGLGLYELSVEPNHWDLLIVSQSAVRPLPDPIAESLPPPGRFARWTGEAAQREAIASRRAQLEALRKQLGELNGLTELQAKVQRELTMMQRLEGLQNGVSALEPLLREPAVVAFTARIDRDALELHGIRLAAGANADVIAKALGPTLQPTTARQLAEDGSYALTAKRKSTSTAPR